MPKPRWRSGALVSPPRQPRRAPRARLDSAAAARGRLQAVAGLTHWLGRAALLTPPDRRQGPVLHEPSSRPLSFGGSTGYVLVYIESDGGFTTIPPAAQRTAKGTGRSGRDSDGWCVVCPEEPLRACCRTAPYSDQGGTGGGASRGRRQTQGSQGPGAPRRAGSPGARRHWLPRQGGCLESCRCNSCRGQFRPMPSPPPLLLRRNGSPGDTSRFSL